MLQFKLYLIAAGHIATNEEPLKQYAGHGYEVFYIKGTCHFAMLENPDELNKLLQKAIYKISGDNPPKK